MNVVAPREGANAPHTRSFLKLYWVLFYAAVLFAAPITDSMANRKQSDVTFPNVELTVRGGAQTINVSSYFTAPDGHELSFSASSSNTSCVTASLSGSTLTITPVVKGCNATITVRASDREFAQSKSFTATVNNSPPWATSAIIGIDFPADSTYSTTVNHNYFSDKDGDTLTFTASSSDTSIVTVSVSGSTLNFVFVAKGSTTVTVTADDGSVSATKTVHVTVRPSENNAPTGSLSDVTLTVAGGAQTVDLSSNFSDADEDTLTYSASSSNTSYVTVSVSGSTLTVTPVAKGSSTITVTANDGKASTNVTFTATVNNSAPTGSLSDVTLTVGGGAKTINLLNSFSDADGDTLYFGVTSSHPEYVTASVSGSTLTLTPVAKGASTIRVGANDGKLALAPAFTATVEDSQTPPEDDPEPNPTQPRKIVSNRPPVVAQAIAPIVLFVEDSESVQTQFSDPDGDALSYSVAGGNSAVSASMSGNTVTITALAEGNATLTVTATDTHGATATQTIGVTVVEPQTALPNIPGNAARLLIVSGDNQYAQVNTALPNPLVVEVRDAQDRVVEGVAVQFALDQSGATLDATSTTDAAGQASATLMFGDSPGEFAVEASAAGVDETVVFTATATPLFPEPTYIDTIEATANPGDSRAQRVYGVAFSPDGEMLASAHNDKTVRLWKVETRELIQTLEGHLFAVRSVAFSPDGNTLASGGMDSRVLLWDLDTGKLKQIIRPGGTVWGIDFSPDGDTLATATEYGHVSIWDISNLRRVERKHRIRAHSVRAWSVSFNPNGDMLASVGGDAIVRLWNPETGEVTKELSGHEEQVLSVAFGGGNTLASAGADGSVRLWDLETESNRVLDGHTGWVFSAAFHPNGEMLASTGKDNSVRLWHAGAGTPLHVLERHTAWGRSIAISRGGILASGGYDNMIHLWDLGVKLEDMEDTEDEEDIQETEENAGGEGKEDTAAQQLAELLPNFPNPFNPETWIPYHLSNNTDVQISIYDSKGELVRWLDLGHQAAGNYTDRTKAAYWDGRNEFGEHVASGLYFYRLTTGDYSETRKMLILK